MRSIVQHETLGMIIYEEGAWTGKKNIWINDVRLVKEDKKTFVYSNGEESKTVYLKGNFVTGVSLFIGNETIEVVPSAKWYEIICSVFIFLLNLVWGNSLSLCAIIPIAGGAIGGGISGLIAMMNILLMKSAKQIGLKLAIWIAMIVAMFFLCFLAALLFVALVVV